MNIASVRFSVLGLAALAAAAFGQEPEKSAWKTGASAGLSLTRGNSETLTFNGALSVEGEKPQLGAIRAGVEANYGEAETAGNRETTVDNTRLFANVRKTLSERTFAYLDAAVARDEIADVDYRSTLGPGAGFQAIKTEKTTLSFEGGASYVWEKTGGARDDFLALRFAERFTQVLSATAKLWQSVEILPQADDLGRFLSKAELGVEAAINARFSLRAVLQHAHDTDPAAGREKNDLALVVGLGYKTF